MLALPLEAERLIARRGIDRAKANRKLQDVLVRVVSGFGSAAAIRSISVMGSYAGGALQEPTEVNANRFAQLPGVWMSLNDVE